MKSVFPCGVQTLAGCCTNLGSLLSTALRLYASGLWQVQVLGGVGLWALSLPCRASSPDLFAHSLELRFSLGVGGRIAKPTWLRKLHVISAQACGTGQGRAQPNRIFHCHLAPRFSSTPFPSRKHLYMPKELSCDPAHQPLNPNKAIYYLF